MSISGSHLLDGIPCRTGNRKVSKNQDVTMFCGVLKCMGAISADLADVKSV